MNTNEVIIVFGNDEELNIPISNKEDAITALGKLISEAVFVNEESIEAVSLPTIDIPSLPLKGTINTLVNSMIKVKYPEVEVVEVAWVKGGWGAKTDILEVKYWKDRGFEADTYTELHKEIIAKFGKVLNLCDEMDAELKKSGLEHKGCKFGTYHYTLKSALKKEPKS